MQQHDVITEQFGKTANAYLSSAIHAQGADLVLMQEAARRHGRPVVLDLGCGAGHASFAVAPVAASVVAYDLAQPMLDVVEHAKVQRGLDNISTRQLSASAPATSFQWCAEKRVTTMSKLASANGSLATSPCCVLMLCKPRCALAWSTTSSIGCARS